MNPIVTLVTGGTGLIGNGIRHCLESLGEAQIDETWIFMSSRDADLTDAAATFDFFERVKPHRVIHLAASVGGLYSNEIRNADVLRLNLLINDNVLNACHRLSVKRVISCLSNSIFSENSVYPVDESSIHEGLPHKSNFGYSMSKRILDAMSRCYAQQFDSERVYSCVILTNVFGPHDNFSTTQGTVMPSLIHRAHNAKITGKPLTVWGTGSALRQFVFSYDLGRLLVWAIRNYEDSEPLILSTDESDEISIRQAAEMVAKKFGLQSDQLQFDTSKSDAQLRKTVSNAKLKRLLPEFRFTPIEEALKLTCEWFEKNFETARK